MNYEIKPGRAERSSGVICFEGVEFTFGPETPVSDPVYRAIIDAYGACPHTRGRVNITVIPDDPEGDQDA